MQDTPRRNYSVGVRVCVCVPQDKGHTHTHTFVCMCVSQETGHTHKECLDGSETWVPLAPHLKCLQAFLMGCLRVLLGVSRWDKLRNTELRSLGGLERVDVMVIR